MYETLRLLDGYIDASGYGLPPYSSECFGGGGGGGKGGLGGGNVASDKSYDYYPFFSNNSRTSRRNM